MDAEGKTIKGSAYTNYRYTKITLLSFAGLHLAIIVAIISAFLLTWGFVYFEKSSLCDSLLCLPVIIFLCIPLTVIPILKSIREREESRLSRIIIVSSILAWVVIVLLGIPIIIILNYSTSPLSLAILEILVCFIILSFIALFEIILTVYANQLAPEEEFMEIAYFLFLVDGLFAFFYFCATLLCGLLIYLFYKVSLEITDDKDGWPAMLLGIVLFILLIATVISILLAHCCVSIGKSILIWMTAFKGTKEV